MKSRTVRIDADVRDALKTIAATPNAAVKQLLVMPPERKLALRFAIAMRETLSFSEWAEMKRLNAAEKNTLICHSHDYCDANMVMLNACEGLGVLVWDEDKGEMRDETIELWNKAWAIARAERMV